MSKSNFTPNEKLAEKQLQHIKGGSEASVKPEMVQEKGTPVSSSTTSKPTSV